MAGDQITETEREYQEFVRQLTEEVYMNHQGVIEVDTDEEPKTIGTSALGGCLAVAAVIEDESGKRRCGLAHYDPMTLRLELERKPTPESIVHLFNQTAQVDVGKLVKKGVVVMSIDPDGQQKAFIDGIKTEAHYLLGCDDVKIIDYGSNPNERLAVKLPNKSAGSPTVATKHSVQELHW